MSATTHTRYQDGEVDVHLTAPLAESPYLLRSQARGLLAISSVFMVATWITVGLRCYVRARILKKFGLNDYFMVITLVLFTAYASMCVIFAEWVLESAAEYASGAIPTSVVFPNLMVVAYCIYVLTMVTFRFGLGLYFLSIFHVYTTWRIVINVTLVAFTLCSVFELVWTFVYPCQVQMLFFVGLSACEAQTIRVDWEIITAIWSFVTAVSDVVYAVLSVFALRKLQLPLKTKIQGALLCGLGSIGGLASFVRLVLLVVNWPGASLLGQCLHFTIWSIIEPGLGTTAAALATLRPLVRHLKERGEVSFSGQDQESRTQNHLPVEIQEFNPTVLTKWELPVLTNPPA